MSLSFLTLQRYGFSGTLQWVVASRITLCRQLRVTPVNAVNSYVFMGFVGIYIKVYNNYIIIKTVFSHHLHLSINVLTGLTGLTYIKGSPFSTLSI